MMNVIEKINTIVAINGITEAIDRRAHDNEEDEEQVPMIDMVAEAIGQEAVPTQESDTIINPITEVIDQSKIPMKEVTKETIIQEPDSTIEATKKRKNARPEFTGNRNRSDNKPREEFQRKIG